MTNIFVHKKTGHYHAKYTRYGKTEEAIGATLIALIAELKRRKENINDYSTHALNKEEKSIVAKLSPLSAGDIEKMVNETENQKNIPVAFSPDFSVPRKKLMYGAVGPVHY